MPKDQEVLTGEVTNYYHPSGNRPAKLIVADGEATFELTIYPENGVEQPWDEDSKLPAFMHGLPVDIVGVSIQTIAEPKGAYNGGNQYKPSKITVLGSSPGPKAATPAAPAAPAAPAQAPKYLTNPNDRDILIVDQVIFKGAIDLLRGDTTVAKAVEDAILAWEGVRARHLPKEEDTLEEDDFGSL